MNLRFFFIYIFLGLFVFLRIVFTPEPLPFPEGTQIQSQARLMSTPRISGNTQRVSVNMEGRKLTLITSRFADLRYGDLLDIRGTVTNWVPEGGKTVSMIYFPHITVIESDIALPYHVAGWIQERVRESIRLFLPPSEASLLMGIVFGINEGFSDQVEEAFQITGVMHVIAASGMNVTLLAGFLLPFLGRFFKRDQAVFLTIVCIGFYTVLAGMSASIVRASLMASIGFLGLLLGRQRTALLGLYITGCIMLGINPLLISDIGFQLSFVATLGILVVKPLLPILPQNKLLDFIGDDLTSTISAQITTLPLLVFYFHSFGLLTILANTLVLWVIPPVMVIGSLASCLAVVSTSVGGLLSLLTLPFLSYFLFLTQFFAQVSPVVTVTTMPVSLILGYYFMLLAIIWKLKDRNKAREVHARGKGSLPLVNPVKGESFDG